MPKALNFRGYRAPFRPRAGLLSACSLLLSLLVGLGSPVQAQAFSNAGAFLFDTSKVLVEDIAICTKFKYPFDPSTNGGFTWNQTGYETCPSESLTIDSLPATLHIKFRVQSVNSEEFLASAADAYISDSKGVRVNTSRWAPSPLIDLDGPFNQRDAVYYAAFSIADPKIFPVGSYSLTIQFWNSHWVKLNGPNIPETPKSFTPFSFTIAAGKAGSTSNSEAGSCEIDRGYEDYVLKSKQSLELIYMKVNSITDFSAPGIANLLQDYAATAKDESSNVLNTTAKFDAIYKGQSKEKCTSYMTFWYTATSVQTQASNVRSLIDAYYVKAKAAGGTNDLEKNQAVSCQDTSGVILADIKKSYNLITVYGEKFKGPFDFTSNSTNEMFSNWAVSLKTEYANLAKYRALLTEYSKQDPDCQNYGAGVAMIAEATSKYSSVVNMLDALKAKAGKSQVKQESPDEETYADEEGIEEEPTGSLVASYSASQGRFILKVESNLPDESLTVRATKRGAKPLRFTINTDEDGIGGVRTKTKLSGYTLTLYYGSTKLDQVRVK